MWKTQRKPNKKIPPFSTLRMENGGFLFLQLQKVYVCFI